jgi:hypothetical protein
MCRAPVSPRSAAARKRCNPYWFGIHVTLDITILIAFIFVVGLGMGGGLYETRAIYPLWKSDPQPATLVAKLNQSGQAMAARRFWPLVSPLALLLAIANIVSGWSSSGVERALWLGAAIAIVLKSLVTFLYFVPTMIGKLEHADSLTEDQLKGIVALWTKLSPLRLVVEAAAWISAIAALLLMKPLV